MHFKVDIVLHISEGWLALCLDTGSLEKKGLGIELIGYV
jgi:hypothetical protein